MHSQRRVSFELRSLSSFIKRSANRELSEKIDHELTPVQMGVMMYLYKHKEQDIFQRDIEEEFSMRRSTATNILQKMEKKHLITRQSVAYDARLKKIFLTHNALELREQASFLFYRLEERLTNGITEEDLNTFFSVVDQMKENMKEIG